MKLLLINPRFPESFWSFRWVLESIVTHKRTVNPPLGLATLAALCPEGWEVEIIDENIESIPLAPTADLVGICGMGVQFSRQRELLAFYRSKGYFVVAGGSYASLCPELYESLADSVVAGEAEYIWPQFCRDFELANQRLLYRETGVVSLSDSPVPRLDLLKLTKYQAVSLQFSRGCPFRCEFCDIIVMFGRKPRTKSLEQVGAELDLLREHNVDRAFFVDDNLIGNKRVAKDLLRYIRDYQRRHGYRFRFGTEASLNLAQDDELLQLFREANFEWVFIGIESPDEESLKETKKFQNTRQDILSSVRHIYSHGIDVFAGMIIGFDNDTVESFEKQYQFIMESGIQAAMIGLLAALPKTPLYERLEREGRLIPNANNSDNTKLGTNIIPKRMRYEEMVTGYRKLHHRLLRDRSIADRIKNKVRYLTQPAYKGDGALGRDLKVLRKLLVHGIWAGGVSRIFHFCRSIVGARLRQIPLVVHEWVVALAMRDYVNRHFAVTSERERAWTRSRVRNIEKALKRYLHQGALEISFSEVKHAAANLSISMKGWLDRGFFTRASRQLEKVLESTTSSITLRIEEIHETQLHHLHRLLNRLSQYGDRINITVREELRHLIDIDSSVFNLVFE